MHILAPKVTVITITYNLINAMRKENFLQCVESVKNQSYSNIEHIIIDGASSDGTLELIQSTGLEYYSEPDSGIYDAMNKGIEKATGKYIAFLNSDDFWHGETGVAISVKALEKSGADFSYANSMFLHQDSEIWGEFHSQLSCFPVNMPICSQTMFIKLSVLRARKGFDTDFKSAADYDLIIDLLLKGYQAIEVHCNFTAYRLGSISQNDAINHSEIFKLYHKNFSQFSCYAESQAETMFYNKILNSALHEEILTKVHPSLAKDMRANNNLFISSELLQITQVPFLDSHAHTYPNNKRVLIIFHINFLVNDRGCTAHVYEMAKSLKSAGYSLDFFSVARHDDFKNFDEINAIEQLIDNFYCCYDFNYANSSDNDYVSFSWVNDTILASFQNVLKKNKYSHINMHYANWLDLFKFANIPASTKLVYTMHDSLFVQHFYLQNINYGKILEQELELLSYVDEVTCISFDEMLFFKRFLSEVEVTFLPYFLQAKSFEENQKDIDVLFLAYANPYNFEALLWFVDNVCQYLDSSFRITVCGKIWEMLENYAPAYIVKMADLGVNRIDFAQDLDELFANTKISIVPMFSGTGLKIKTIDSLSRGVPVVSTLFGVDGFPDKYNNCCLVSDDPEEFAMYINKMLTDEILYAQQVEKTKNYFDAHFSLDHCYKILMKVFSS